MRKIENGNYVKYIGQHTVYKVVDIIVTQVATYAVLVDNFGFAVDNVKVQELIPVQCRVDLVEVWTEI